MREQEQERLSAARAGNAEFGTKAWHAWRPVKTRGVFNWQEGYVVQNAVQT